MEVLSASMYLVQGFEEIHVPALKPKPFAKDERIVKIKELPSWMHPAFEGMDALNRIQSRVQLQSLAVGSSTLHCDAQTCCRQLLLATESKWRHM